MKIFASHQIRDLDNYTITHEPIESINLMERAAKAIVRAITSKWQAATPVVVFAGPGNNGGDALAVARLLAELGYRVQAFLFNISGKLSTDCEINKKRIEDSKKIDAFTEVTQEFDPPQLQRDMLVIDGLFGSGLSKPLAGGFASLVKYINASPAQVISIDVPSGLMTEDNTYNVRANIIRANYTLTLQQPKLSFFFAENQTFIGQLEILDIKLSAEGMEQIETDFSTIEREEIQQMMLPRSAFAHKGTMGHALLVAGSYGMGGAAILAAKACLRSGVGKVTVHCPKRNNMILQMTVPEAVVQLDQEETTFTEPVETEDFNAMVSDRGWAPTSKRQ